ncbi:Na+/H+ antiporter NhaA [Luteithermobacter gelatinilyticus]|uniref:Na+/H+ antiporter NhaA n=1 Tax=Luteithermobacter gelatinilyticus TaxID=2582913 RepID=UPI001105D17F|nr:Na+/H+ antiporter NhaA [Luteithermobacter gelatinilyticus]
MRKRHFIIAGKTASMDQWGSLMMIGACGVALLWANTPLRPFYDLVHHTPLSISLGGFSLEKPLVVWVNEGLMAFFFLAVALEIKREILEGHLSAQRQIFLPAFAALGGMVVPATLYLLINGNNPEFSRGWPIPTATDIALSLGVLSLFGRRVPVELKLFLASLAIFDDLGGILIIVLLHGGHLSLNVLAVTVLGLVTLFFLNRFDVTHASLYIVIGIFLWAAFQDSGIHPTLAGLMVGAALPLRLHKDGVYVPLHFVERGLHPWVTFFIVPLFAFFNTGIVLADFTFSQLLVMPSLGIVAGLVVGKPLGIFSFAWLAHMSGIARLGSHVTWRLVFGVALLGGIGFTMALFLNALAFPHNGNPETGRMAVLIGSLLSAVIGSVWLHVHLPAKQSEDQSDELPAERMGQPEMTDGEITNGETT